MSSRPLTPAERALVREVFGAAVDAERVRVHHRRWWPLQPRNVIMAPDGAIWCHERSDAWRDCFASASLSMQALFVHEMTHVWQHQRGVNLLLRRHPFCRYSYALKPGWRLERYGIEQQAEIVAHAFLLARGARVPGAPDLATYRSVLPFPTA